MTSFEPNDNMLIILQRISTRLLEMSPATQRIAITVKANKTLRLRAIQDNPFESCREFSEDDKSKPTFKGLALTFPPEWYGRTFIYELNPEDAEYGYFRFYPNDLPDPDRSKLYMVYCFPTETKEFYNDYAVYCASVLHGSEARAAAIIIASDKHFTKFAETDVAYAKLPEADIRKHAELKAADAARSAIIDELSLNPQGFSFYFVSNKDNYDYIPDPEAFEMALRIAENRSVDLTLV
mgnify:CR=1 FL=1